MSDEREIQAERFRRLGFLRLSLPCAEANTAFLLGQWHRLTSADASTPRPWQYCELHNPWAAAAELYDSWGFLDLCSAPATVDALALALGEDIILYDSQWLPDPWHDVGAGSEWMRDEHRPPVEPRAGATALFSVVDWFVMGSQLECLPGSHTGARCSTEALDITPRAGELLICHPKLRYRITCATRTQPLACVVRYFPASSRYLRQASHPMHQALTERYPLLNYARLPLWLVRGSDRADNDFVTGFRARAGRWARSRDTWIPLDAP